MKKLEGIMYPDIEKVGTNGGKTSQSTKATTERHAIASIVWPRRRFVPPLKDVFVVFVALKVFSSVW